VGAGRCWGHPGRVSGWGGPGSPGETVARGREGLRAAAVCEAAVGQHLLARFWQEGLGPLSLLARRGRAGCPGLTGHRLAPAPFPASCLGSPGSRSFVTCELRVLLLA